MTLYVEAGYVLDVVETGGNTFTVTLASGTHFLTSTAAAAAGDFAARVTIYTSFLTALDTALEAGGAGANTYTVAFDKVTERVTITNNGNGGTITAISLTPTTNGGLIGQTAVKSGALAHTMQRTPDYWISGAVGFWSDYHEQESDEDIGFTSRMHDGTPYGVSKDGVATNVDMTIALEPRAKVYTAHAAASDPWTWQKLFRHARNVSPVLVDDGTLKHVLKLRRPAFRPLRRSADYQGHFDVRLETELLARIP